MVLTIRSIHLTNTTSTGIAFVPMAKSYLWPTESLQIVVSAISEGGIEYYGRVEAIYELQFYGENPPNVVVFKCYWFQPKETRRTHEHLGLVEIKQSTHLDVPDVYIMAQQATQVFYLPWACQSDPNLSGWDVVYEVLPHARLSPPKEEDYEPHINQDTYDEGELFQETRLSKKMFQEPLYSTPEH